MPADEAAGDKTEEATPRRRERERERGQVARSRDLTASLVMLGGVLFLRYGGNVIYRWMHLMTIRFLEQDMASVLPPEGKDIVPMIFEWLMWFGYIMLPFMIAMLAIALLANFVQVGFLFTWDPLMPNLNKLNPISGLQRIFGLRGLMTLVFNLLKLVLILSVAYFSLRNDIPEALSLAEVGPEALFVKSAILVGDLAVRLALVVFILGVADFAYQYYQFNQDIMMTRQEVKEEYKEQEGDPQLRARRRQIQRQLAMQRMMQEVPRAEVVVRNPTHVAVAIRYTPEMKAPEVVAKGRGKLAERIIKVAIEHGVPTWSAPPLARQLYKAAEVGETIPPALFPALAEILNHVLRGEKRAKYMKSLAGAA